MDPTLINLNARSGQIISENSMIPPDIVFKFPRGGGQEDEVAAHKMILAMVSDVFQNMFYVHNTVDMSANEIMMDDTTKPPFQMMIDAVYNVKPLKKSLQGKCVHEMFAVLYLVIKYKISELELAVQECLSAFPITEDNVVEVADDAMEFLATFEEAAQSLLLACAKFLQPKFTDDAVSFIRFVADHGDRMATVHKLAELLKDLLHPPSPPTCSNCKKMSTECLNGKVVNIDNLEIGVFKFPSGEGEYGEVAAHKMILAMASDVFQNMFYVHNTVDMSANEIIMDDTTKPPFQMMIDAVYNVKPLKESLRGKSVHEMFAVLYLVTKYKISELELAVKECLSSFPITEDNVVEVADDAMEFLATFGEAAQSLLLACAKFLRPKFTDAKSFMQFVAEHGDRMATVHKLAELLKDLLPPTCSNCKKMSTECLNGELVLQTNVEIGIKVVRNPEHMSYRLNDSNGTGVIIKKDEQNKKHWSIRWENNKENGEWPIYESKSIGSYLLFKCH